MGMFGEIDAEITAKKLEIIILDAMHDEDWFSNRIIIYSFIKKYLYQWYLSECSEAWLAPNIDIVKEFNDK